MVVLFAEDQLPLGGGKLRRNDDVGAVGGEKFIESWGAGGLKSWKIGCFGGQNRLVHVDRIGGQRGMTDLFVELSWW